MSEFAKLFVFAVGWGGMWHFSAYPIEAIIKRSQWAYITKLTVGIITLYPIVEMFFTKLCCMMGMSKNTTDQAKAALFSSYFGAAVAYGSGKVLFTGIEPGDH